MNRGITLIETLVVVTLIGLLAAVVSPAVGSGVETVRLRTSGERLAATMRMARERAVRTRHYWQVSVDPETRIVELRDLQGDAVKQWELPVAVEGEAVSAVFAPDGSFSTLRLTLVNQRGRGLRLEMDALTGMALETTDEHR
jgi:prepilin-type N-terminal cleavage/methylation domain-containing protein